MLNATTPSRPPIDSVAAFAAGQADAFAELYDQYVDQIYGYILRRVSHRETAEDLASQVFLKAFERRSSFSGGNFQAWIYRIAHNAVVDHYRTAKPTASIDDLPLADHHDPDTAVDQRVLLEKVRRLLDSFEPQPREIIIMRLWDGLTFPEIAAALGKGESAVKMSYQRAMATIKRSVIASVILFITFAHIYG